MMYLTDHRSQVLAKLRALINSSLQRIYQLRFNHDPPPVSIPRSRPYLPCHTCSKLANRAGKSTVAELAQKILQTADSNTEEWLNQSIERLDNEDALRSAKTATTEVPKTHGRNAPCPIGT